MSEPLFKVGEIAQVRKTGRRLWMDWDTRLVCIEKITPYGSFVDYVVRRVHDQLEGTINESDLLPYKDRSAKIPQNGILFPADAKERKKIPIGTGVLDYFPAALAEVAKVSYQGNIQHNGPDAPLHWARSKSTDQSDTIIRHYFERGTFDNDGVRHSAKLAWRALALLQLELEAEGAPMARGASND